MNLETASILVTGAGGFLGSHLCEALTSRGLTYARPAHAEFDLLEQSDVRAMFQAHRPTVLFHLAGYVGGIWANKTRPADFFYRNALLNVMTLHEAYLAGVEKVICVMGGCSYPAHAPNPINETSMWEGYPQAESAAYSVAKKMLIVQSEAYRAQYGFNSIVMVPGNVYGPYDNFNLQDSHVIPALIRKVYEATRDGVPALTMWGSGQPVRDFIYARDAADALVRAAECYDSSEIINISSGQPTTIKALVEAVVRLTAFTGEVIWDTSKPDGQMFKGFDVTRMRERLGYTPPTPLEEGLQRTITWFEENRSHARS